MCYVYIWIFSTKYLIYNIWYIHHICVIHILESLSQFICTVHICGICICKSILQLIWCVYHKCVMCIFESLVQYIWIFSRIYLIHISYMCHIYIGIFVTVHMHCVHISYYICVYSITYILTHMCVIYCYGVATISRLLKSIGLFCKRAL